MDSEKAQAPEFIDLLLWIALACSKRMKAIVVSVFLVALFSSLLVVYVLDEEFAAHAVILPPDGGASGAMGALGDVAGDLGPLASSMGIFGSQSQEVYVMMTLLESYQFQRTLIRKFHYDSIYKFTVKPKYFEADLIKAFRKNFKVKQDDDNDFLVISMRDELPQRAKDVVDTALTMLDSAYTAVKITQAGKSRRYFEERIQSNQIALDSLKTAMQKFQETNAILDPEVQIEESVKRLAQMELEKETAYIQWQSEVNVYGAEGALAKKLEKQYQSLAASLRHLKSRKSSSGAWLNTQTAPALLREYEALYTGILINESIYKYLRQMYEQALLEELNQVGRFEVLEKPWVNNKRVAPPRRAIVTSLVVADFVIAVLLCMFFEMYTDQKGRNGRRYTIIQNVLRNLFFWKKSVR